MQCNEMFTQEDRKNVFNFYETRERWKQLLNYRTLPKRNIDTIFYGDSIVEAWPTHEFFPNLSHLNRGIGGDSINGLYFRLDEDIFPYTPRRVIMSIGINGIEWDFHEIIAKTVAVAELMKARGIQVYLNSIAPLREPDQWNRFQYQNKIVQLNKEYQTIFEWDFAGFIDTHAVLADPSGQLSKEFARPDGTHWTFDAYVNASRVVAGKLGIR